jgi:A/G-specific adenine glycosylase
MPPFSERLLAWYERAGRHDLPWQRARSAYHVWVSEIMLQQTQVGTVIPYFERFIARFPDVVTLATSALDEVLHHWSGLGYYARARNLHKSAQLIIADHQGEFPKTLEAAMALPGVGRSTAGAVLALSYQQRHPILDGNVKRVLTRYAAIAGWPQLPAVQTLLWALADSLTPRNRVVDYTQAIMDLGAMVCTRSAPSCEECPVATTCAAHLQGKVAEFPGRKPRRALPRRSTVFLILADRDGALLLEKRPPTGIWGGLWSFPEVPDDTNYRAWCTNRGFSEVNEFTALPTIEHTFTHFHLAITPITARVPHQIACMDSDRWLWYNCDAPALVGLAKPVAQIISMRKSLEGM